MRTILLLESLVALIGSSLAACSDEDPPTSSSTPTTDSGALTNEGGSADGGDVDSSMPVDDAGEDAGAYVEQECQLRNDTGGPGQYTDTCVRRSWIADYAGTYTSASCKLTIDVTGSVAATFDVQVTGGDLAGAYLIAWDGAPSPGNDSYYRFTTDATFATTKAINFTAAQTVGTTDERAFGLRIDGLDTGTPIYNGRAFQVIGGVSKDHDCGAMTKQ